MRALNEQRDQFEKKARGKISSQNDDHYFFSAKGQQIWNSLPKQASGSYHLC